MQILFVRFGIYTNREVHREIFSKWRFYKTALLSYSLSSLVFLLTFIPVTASSTQKKGRVGKMGLIEEIRDCLDNFKFVYVFEVQNSRNKLMKEVRTKWEPSRCV